MTERLDARRPADIDRAVELLRRGAIVAFPTETVYGLGASGLDPAAVARIFAAKQRPADNPLILHVPDLAAARPLWRASEREQYRADACAERFWPGPLTLVLPKSSCVPPVVTAGLASVGVRAPAHPVARAILARLGGPVAAPSANASGRPSPTCAEHVLATLSGRIDAVVDGGPTEVGIESTVVDLTGTPTVLRPGSISHEELSDALGERVAPFAADRPARASPGLRHRHYAPAVDRIEVRDHRDIDDEWTGTAALLLFASTHARLRERHGERSAPVRILADDSHLAMRGLYAALYDLERSSARRLVIELPPSTTAWEAVRDRLRRAAGD